MGNYTPFDWITPLGGLLTRGKDIHITDAPGMSAREVLSLLKQNGIKARWPQVTDDGLLVKVDDEQKALRVLARHGITAY